MLTEGVEMEQVLYTQGDFHLLLHLTLHLSLDMKEQMVRFFYA